MVASLGAPKEVVDRTHRHGLDDGSGGGVLLLFKVGGWCLKTSTKRRFLDVDEGRAALLRLARAKRQIGMLIPPDTTLSLEAADDGAYWLWTVCPWLSTTRALMRDAVAAADDHQLVSALEAYAMVALEAAELAMDRGAALDVHPSNFASYRSGSVYYIDDDIEKARRLPALGHSLLQRVQEYSDFANATEHYVALIEEELPRRFDRRQVDMLGLEESIATAAARCARVTDAKERWLNALARRRQARP